MSCFHPFSRIYSLFIFVNCLHYSLASDLEKKCDFLRTRTRAGFIGKTCFATTVEKYSTSFDIWHCLHKKCVDVHGYTGRMAFIRTREQIDGLIRQGIIETHGRYFVGIKQAITPKCDMGCFASDEEDSGLDSVVQHKKGWHYVDDQGRMLEEVPQDLWLKDEPNNQGEDPPENVATLERLNDVQLGLNDANGEQQHFQVLCEYGDFGQDKPVKMPATQGAVQVSDSVLLVIFCSILYSVLS